MVLAVQPTLEDLGLPLHEVTFVVVDLETTGGSARSAEITEVGAVKVRGGQVLGEFQTLVSTHEPIPPFITALTGITNAMVCGAPGIGSVIPAFLEFAAGAVLVAHNAPFDVSFLRAATASVEMRWPNFPVVDTAALARRLVDRSEARDRRLGTLAALFGAATTPNHRALDDARATVDVLHALLGRLGSMGVTHAEDLAWATDAVPPARRAKRHLADGLPTGPGVYMFKDDQGEVLYIGTATNLRRRVRSYFTRAEKRKQIEEMVALATQVVPIECATPLEAQVRELRMIAQYSPRYNRRSRFPERRPWVKYTPRRQEFTVARVLKEDGSAYIGPYHGRAQALDAIAALRTAFDLTGCAEEPPDPARLAEAIPAAMRADPAPVVEALAPRMRRAAADLRFEDAARLRDRLEAFCRGAARTQRIEPLARCPQLVAARPVVEGWEIVVVRHGRLAATATARRGTDPRVVARSLSQAGERPERPVPPAPACTVEEAELVASWLESAGVRLVEVAGEWTCPVRGAAAWRHDGTGAHSASDGEAGPADVTAPAAHPAAGPGPTQLRGETG